MIENEVLDAIENLEILEDVAGPLQQAVHAILPDTDSAREVEDVLHGKWLGHPVHPAVTDVPVGAWTVALVLDVLESRGRRELGPGADAAIAVGLAGAMVAAVTGLADWKYTKGRTRRLGAAHAITNAKATTLYLASLILRRRGARTAAKQLSTLGYVVISAGAWMGGELTYRHHMGTNHATGGEMPEEWTPVLAEESLAEDVPTRVDAAGTPVVLVRRGKWISALAATCTHMGGPLDEGTLDGECLVCPWHGSTFNLDDGGVVLGPASYPQPVFATRVVNGQIEVRLERR